MPVAGRKDLLKATNPKNMFKSRTRGPSARAKQYRFQVFWAQAPLAPEAPGMPPGPCVEVSGTSGALPEAPVTHHEPNQKTDEPNRID